MRIPFRPRTPKRPGQDEQLEKLHQQADAERTETVRARIKDVILTGGMSMAYQPIVDMDTSRPVGYEALARFNHGTPDQWFTDADTVDLSDELELHAVAQALTGSAKLPLAMFISVNVNPRTLASNRLGAILRDADSSRVVLELTEHIPSDRYDAYIPILQKLRQLGVRIAVTDSGGGVASMRQVVHLAPDYIKLDRSLVRLVNTDSVRRSMCKALAAFAGDIGATVIAEGVEQEPEAAVLRELGIHHAQGWLYGTEPLLELPTVMVSKRRILARAAG
ncbi:MAG: EAL domain-containing protein [Candidatus Dormibacteria bacterium]